jgi:UDP-N-acetylmuramoyl-L-alanyl-D-glutamate--2,6-diaminopimelate ligase
MIANIDDERGPRFLAIPVESQIPFSLSDAQAIVPKDGSISFLYKGTRFDIPHPGNMSVLNAIAAVKAAEFVGVDPEVSAKALAALTRIPGRAEKIEVGQDFAAIVDYAHTPDSLRALYAAYPTHRKICVLGNTGGGRDTWKRPLMGSIADETCTEVILTNEDPYDEDPNAIVEAMAAGMKRTPTIIMDRREAIRAALSLAKPGDAVLISGKGTDPYIMEAKGKKRPWSDASVVREELLALLKEKGS